MCDSSRHTEQQRAEKTEQQQSRELDPKKCGGCCIFCRSEREVHCTQILHHQQHRDASFAVACAVFVLFSPIFCTSTRMACRLKVSSSLGNSERSIRGYHPILVRACATLRPTTLCRSKDRPLCTISEKWIWRLVCCLLFFFFILRCSSHALLLRLSSMIQMKRCQNGDYDGSGLRSCGDRRV